MFDDVQCGEVKSYGGGGVHCYSEECGHDGEVRCDCCTVARCFSDKIACW